MNLYLGQDKVEESVSLPLFFQSGMSSLSSPWVQISLVLQAHCQGAFPDSPVHTNLCLLGSVPYNLAVCDVNLASQANLRMWVSLALLGPLGLCQPTGTPHVGCLTRLGHGWGGPGVRDQAEYLCLPPTLLHKTAPPPEACPSSHRFLI